MESTLADSRIQIQENFTDLIVLQKESIWSIPVYKMATSQVLDVKTDADYVALRRRMSRIRVQNSKQTDDDDNGKNTNIFLFILIYFFIISFWTTFVYLSQVRALTILTSCVVWSFLCSMISSERRLF